MRALLKLLAEGQVAQMQQMNVVVKLLREIADTLNRIEKQR